MDPNTLLQEVRQEAENLGVPVSPHLRSEVRINPRPRSRLGCCRALPDGSYEIEISKIALGGSETSLRELLAHELLHSCKGCLNHGKLWKKYAAVMESAYGYSITRTVDPKELGIEQQPREPRYILRCQSCGAEIKRQRECRLTKHPALYRCGACGGRLKVIKRP